MNKTIDCKGMACPLPVITAKKAVEEFTEDGTMTVLVDNETAVQNLTRLGGKLGYAVASGQKAEKEYEVTFEVKGTGKEASPEAAAATVDANRGACVVISSDKMGDGDEKLGRSLMKMFIFALTNVDPTPEAVVFYNRGAFLTTEGSDSIEDLKALEAAGTKILTCGACLNHYGIKEKLQVGVVSNMYEIVETQNESVKIIRP